MQEPVVPLCILRATAIGVITMSGDKGQDDKIVAVHVDDPEDAHSRDISELPPHRLKELECPEAAREIRDGERVTVMSRRVPF